MFSFVCVILTCAAVIQNQIKLYTYIDAPNFTARYIPNDNLSTLRINPKKPLRFLTHGWRQNYRAEWFEAAISAYYKQDTIDNVIVIDWSTYADTIWYPHAARDTEPVGHIVGELILMICNEFEVPLRNVHLVGNSLGAHIFGFAGKHIYLKTGRNIGRITGLDPAGLYFEDKPVDKRLAKSDADFLDVIHTDIYFLGYKNCLGHIDYYPNGGYGQPGCSFFLLDVYCNHRRATSYYVESINSDRLKAWKCDTFEEFKQLTCAENKQILLSNSDRLDYDIEGSYYLATNANAPFGCSC